jgi:undecaprenyl-diphosphatase
LPSRAAVGQSPHAHTLSLAQALALGALQGPTEFLPISSSGHMTVVPWLLGWSYTRLDPELRKAFEVALHAGAGLALAGGMRAELVPLLSAPRLLVLSQAPAALAGFALERPIEARLGTPATVAAGLIAGGLAIAAADCRPQPRRHQDAGPRDALWLGIAQACALFPGVSRGGATLTAARVLGFARADAQRLSRRMALPVILGAASLKAARLRARTPPAELRAPFLAGALASFASTLASRPLRHLGEGEQGLRPFAVYRIALGALVLQRLRSAGSTTMGR